MREHPGVLWLQKNEHLMNALSAEYGLADNWIAIGATGPVGNSYDDNAVPIASPSLTSLAEDLRGIRGGLGGLAFHLVDVDLPTSGSTSRPDIARPR